MVKYPIVPKKTAMLFFDTLNIYYHPKDPGARAAVERSGVLGKEFFMAHVFPRFARVMTVRQAIAAIQRG